MRGEGSWCRPCPLGEGGRLVLREGTERLEWAAASLQEVGVSDKDQDALVEAVGEVPIVVRVEIGVAEMRAREWASLAPGDVVVVDGTQKLKPGLPVKVQPLEPPAAGPRAS